LAGSSARNSALTTSLPIDIVNLFVKMKDTDELEGEKQWKDNERRGSLCA
jgi:hypothetical protein